MIKLPNTFDVHPYALERDEFSKIQRNINAINAPELWARNIHGESRVIAVIDTGCDVHHGSLAENIIGGYNFVSDDPDAVNDSTGHGTHVAGIIASKGAMIGVAPESKLLILKVFDRDGATSYDMLVKALDYAIKWRGANGEKVEIINLSLGSNKGDDTFESKVKEAYEKGIIIVGASGNSGDGNEESIEKSYPSYYKEVVQVGAADHDGEIAYISNTNPKIDFFAPGVNILSTVPGGEFSAKTGTSMAAPHVTGGLALLLNDYTSEELMSFLLSRRENPLAKADNLNLVSLYGIGLYYGADRFKKLTSNQ